VFGQAGGGKAVTVGALPAAVSYIAQDRGNYEKNFQRSRSGYFRLSISLQLARLANTI
jgi:hypothetical protein